MKAAAKMEFVPPSEIIIIDLSIEQNAVTSIMKLRGIWKR